MIEILLPNSEEPGNYTSHQRTSEEFDEVGGTNSLEMAVGPGDGLQPLDSPGSVTNSPNQGLTGEFGPVAAGALGDPPPVTDGWEGFTPITSTNTTRTLDADDFRRGFVLTGIGTGESHGFEAPSNAVVCADWLAFGAAEDWIYLAFTDWAFRLGTNEVDRLRVFSFGKVDPLPPATDRWFAPFMASLGIVPAANWHLIPQSSNPPDPQPLNPSTSQHSLFWHCVTPSNTLQMTWQNVLLGRATNTPVNVQMEVWPSGRFTCRYDLSRLCVEEVTDILVGASLGGLAWTTNALPANLTSLAFSPLFSEDAVNPDRDGDGLATIDELFAYGTDPGSADTDMDGLSDGAELDVWHTDPLNPRSLSSSFCDGVAVVIGDEDPWSVPEGSTNTVWEHIFYSGTTNGAFAYPQSTDTHAVLSVTVSGPGSGELVVGGTVVPLLAPPQTRSSPSPASSTLHAPIRKGVTYPMYLRADGSLTLAVSSDDFAFGTLPDAGQGRYAGRINFPNVKATVPCIHDLNACRTSVTLPVGADASALTCTWHGGGDVEVEDRPPRSAQLTGTFSPKTTAAVTYTVGHPLRLFGRADHVQTVRFCPCLSEEEEDPEREPGAVPLPDDGDGGADGGANGESGSGASGGEEDYPHAEDGDPWRDPDNGDDPAVAGSGGGTGPGGGASDPDPQVCPEHGEGYAECQAVHDAEYAEASAALPPLNGVLPIRDPTLYWDIRLEVPAAGAPTCCPCPSHGSNYVAAAYRSSRLSLVDGEGVPFGRAMQSCTVHVGGVRPSEAVGDARLRRRSGSPSRWGRTRRRRTWSWT